MSQKLVFNPFTGTLDWIRGLINLASSSEVTGILPTVNGGTGLGSPGTSGNVLTSNGTIWTSATPAGVDEGFVYFMAGSL